MYPGAEKIYKLKIKYFGATNERMIKGLHEIDDPHDLVMHPHEMDIRYSTDFLSFIVHNVPSFSLCNPYLEWVLLYSNDQPYKNENLETILRNIALVPANEFLIESPDSNSYNLFSIIQKLVDLNKDQITILPKDIPFVLESAKTALESNDINLAIPIKYSPREQLKTIFDYIYEKNPILN